MSEAAINIDGEIRAIALCLIDLGAAEIKEGKMDIGMQIIGIADDLISKIPPRITN